jgi:hypothetical protein
MLVTSQPILERAKFQTLCALKRPLIDNPPKTHPPDGKNPKKVRKQGVIPLTLTG